MKYIILIVGLVFSTIATLGLLSAGYSAFILGGLLWKATLVQLTLELIPYIIGFLLVAACVFYSFKIFKDGV